MHTKARVFVSHSSKDKPFVRRLSEDLLDLGVPIWFDDWEIAPGDSIIERVYSGLDASDALLVVLSQESVKSRWVSEELSVAVMRRLSADDIRVIPVLLQDCAIPTPLKHIKYSDFRTSYEAGIVSLLEGIAPSTTAWKSLAQHFAHFKLLAQKIVQQGVTEESSQDLVQMHDLLQIALDIRSQIELQEHGRITKSKTFFDQIEALASSGIDVRSQSWSSLVAFRAELAHKGMHSLVMLESFVRAANDGRAVKHRLQDPVWRLTTVMGRICIENWEPNESETRADA